MNMFILSKVLKKAVTAYELIKIKVSTMSKQFVLDDVKLTSATEAFLKSSSVNKDAKEIFRKDCVTFIVNLVQKLREKSPLKH